MVAVGVAVAVAVAVRVAVAVTVAVRVAVAVGVAVGAVPLTVIWNVNWLWLPQELVYVTTKAFMPLLRGMLSTSRVVAIQPLGPAQYQLPPVVGCGPRFTADPVVTVALAVCCQAPPLTSK